VVNEHTQSQSIWRRLYNWWMRDEILIREWETRTGTAWLREGLIKKGGQNGPPLPGYHPPPPQSLRTPSPEHPLRWIAPPPLRHVVKGWWIYREFDTEVEANNYLRHRIVRVLQGCVIVVIAATLIVIMIRLNLSSWNGYSKR
jgi:hypothetical protein